MWSSVDPRTGAEVQYESSISDAIERAYQNRESCFKIVLGGANFWVRFDEMKQYNAAGLSRTVRRQIINSEPDVKVSPFELFRELSSHGFQTAQECFELVDRDVEALQSNLKRREYRMIQREKKHVDSILQIYDVILAAFPMFVERYQGTQDDVRLLSLKVGDSVPEYFANVKTGSIFRRKVLAVLGLRNLVVHGTEVFNQMISSCFSGNPSEQNSNGLARMKFLTGNTVDMDTVVLNAAAAFNQIKRNGDSRFLSEADFSASPECRETVLQSATHFIDDFVATVGLSPAEVKARKLSMPTGPIHVATCNNDRGKYSVWHYRQMNVSTFHVNVPQVSEVIGAVLKAPFHLAKAFLLHMHYHSTKENPFEDFFENCVSDSCLNGKWKAIEMFLDGLINRETIFAVLDRLQVDNQAKLSRIVRTDDDERTNEFREMCRLVKIGRLQGVDASKKMRPIVDEDVAEWIKRTN